MTGEPVYLVNNNHCGDCGRIQGVFSTREAAQAFASRQPWHTSGMGWAIEQWQLDAPLTRDDLPNVQLIAP
jgi:hypothetical protein